MVWNKYIYTVYPYQTLFLATAYNNMNKDLIFLLHRWYLPVLGSAIFQQHCLTQWGKKLKIWLSSKVCDNVTEVHLNLLSRCGRHNMNYIIYIYILYPFLFGFLHCWWTLSSQISGSYCYHTLLFFFVCFLNYLSFLVYFYV